MKKYYLHISEEHSVTDKAFRDKKDYVNTLIKFIQVINIMPLSTLQVCDVPPNATIYVDKMSRLFLIEKDKIHSIHLPFYIQEIKDDSGIEYLGCFFEKLHIDSKSLCVLEAFQAKELKDDNFFEEMFYSFFEIMDDLDIDTDRRRDWYWKLICHIYQIESGYLRYDNDTQNNITDNHPQKHIDFFYEGNNTFKIGLSKEITYEDMIQMLNIEDHCWKMYK